MNWKDVCENAHLRNLPFRIELNEEGQILMSPVKVYHAVLQGKMVRLLNALRPEGEAFPECAITTDRGTRVAYVVWVSPERLKTIENEDECSIAPEICVEILSSSNTQKEIREKKELYFASGALEVWFCDAQGRLKFFTAEQEQGKSALVPDFPDQIAMSTH